MKTTVHPVSGFYVKSAFILPAILLCLTACKKEEEVKSLKQNAADATSAIPAAETAQRKAANERIHEEADEKKRQIDAKLKKSLETSKQIGELNDSNLALARQNVELAKAGANPADIDRNNAKIEENQQTINELKARQTREMPQPSDMERAKELMAKIPDSAERRKKGIASLNTMIADDKDAREKLIAARDKLTANREAPEVIADAQATIDKISREIETLEQRKRDEEKALQEFLRKSPDSP